MHARLAAASDAGKVIISEINPQRAELAMQRNEYTVVNPALEDLSAVVSHLSNGVGVDLVIVAAASGQAQSEAVELAAIGGRINYFGSLPKDRSVISFDTNLVHYKELIVTGTSACSTQDCVEAAGMINNGQVDLSGLVSERYDLQEIHAALDKADQQDALKIIVEPRHSGKVR
jgi:L-iditol 2-dehydrogenase